MKRILGMGIAVAIAMAVPAAPAAAGDDDSELKLTSSNVWDDAWSDDWCEPWSDRTTFVLPRSTRKHQRLTISRSTPPRASLRLRAYDDTDDRWNFWKNAYGVRTGKKSGTGTYVYEFEHESRVPVYRSKKAGTRIVVHGSKSRKSTSDDDDSKYAYEGSKRRKSTWDDDWKSDRYFDTRTERRSYSRVRDRDEGLLSTRRYGDDDWSDRRYRDYRRRDPWDRYDTPARVEFSVMGGFASLKSSDGAFADDINTAPIVGILGFSPHPAFALEGDFTLSVPVRQTLDVAPGIEAERKGPNLLLFQGGMRFGSPAGSWTPYVAAGAGVATFLQNAEPNRYPQLDRHQTMPAANIGLGALIRIGPLMSARLDFREFALFPPDDGAGITAGSSSDIIWMPRGTFGFTYGY